MIIFNIPYPNQKSGSLERTACVKHDFETLNQNQSCGFTCLILPWNQNCPRKQSPLCLHNLLTGFCFVDLKKTLTSVSNQSRRKSDFSWILACLHCTDLFRGFMKRNYLIDKPQINNKIVYENVEG